jgi:hypothetical protein
VAVISSLSPNSYAAIVHSSSVKDREHQSYTGRLHPDDEQLLLQATVKGFSPCTAYALDLDFESFLPFPDSYSVECIGSLLKICDSHGWRYCMSSPSQEAVELQGLISTNFIHAMMSMKQLLFLNRIQKD